MSNVTCFIFIVVQFAGRRESNPDNSRIALSIVLCLRWNRKPCRPVCRSFPAVRAFRVICPMESSVLFRFATAILRRVIPAPSSPYLHSGLRLKRGLRVAGDSNPLLISKQQPIFPISLFFPVATRTGYFIGTPPFCSMFTYRRMIASAPSYVWVCITSRIICPATNSA